ncbi:MAG: O-antigen ligase family protein [Clostridia bacterium]|nr:O-antigen ligase family protein [Clostridia bacterium]
MKNLLKKITPENILCFIVIICPILDMLSFIFRNTFNTSISPSTFIRPILPIILFIYVFFKYKIKMKMIIISLIYFVYALIHLYLFNSVKAEISYGGILNEAQYLVNYSFLIMNLFLFTYIFWKKDNKKLQKSILIAFGIYIISIYISIITNTSSSTYIEGTGFKGWYESGNSLCAILCICLCIILPMLKDKKLTLIIAILGIFAGIFLSVLVGTRTGLLGFVLILLLYVGSELFVGVIKKININKKIIGASAIAIVLIVVVAIIGGSKTFERRRYIDEIQASATDSMTGEIRHLSGDVTELAHKIENGELTEEYAPKPVQNAILRLYNYAKATSMSSSDMRKQQFMYNLYLVEEQKSLPLLLFGNGFKAQFRELVLEMEVPAFLFNFGLLGFVLYFVPFLIIACYGIYFAVKHLKQIDTNYIMYLGGSLLAIALSFLSGYTFFNSSSMIMVIVVYVLLINKILEILKIRGNLK